MCPGHPAITGYRTITRPDMELLPDIHVPLSVPVLHLHDHTLHPELGLRHPGHLEPDIELSRYRIWNYHLEGGPCHPRRDEVVQVREPITLIAWVNILFSISEIGGRKIYENEGFSGRV